MKIVLLNGPPGSGKDTAGKALSVHLGARVAKFAEALKLATHAMFGILDAPADAFECTKGVPSVLFGGMTPRQAYITVSERMVKPALGDRFFGGVLARRLVAMREAGTRLVAVTDSGFSLEAEPLVAAFGAGNLLLVRLHADGRGCTFHGDSREHIRLPGVATIDIRNDGPDPDAFGRAVVAVVSAWMDGSEVKEAA